MTTSKVPLSAGAVDDNRRRFFRKNFSYVLWPLTVLMVGLVTMPLMFRSDSRERLEELSGHLATMRVQRSSDEASAVEFTVKEHSRTFIVPAMREIDLAIFVSTEKLGNKLEFAVEKADFDDASQYKLEVHRLASEKEVYVRSTNIAAMMRGDRRFAGFIFFTSLALALWLGARLRKKYLHDIQERISDEWDPYLIAIALHPLRSALIVCAFLLVFLWAALPSGTALGSLVACALSFGAFAGWYRRKAGSIEWIKEAMEYEVHRRAARAVKTATSAPKHVKAVQLLLKSGVDINIRNSAGQTALHIAASVGSAEATDLLMRTGAEINLADNNGDTALIIAARNGNLGIVMKLLEKGADPLHANAKGETALSAAEANKRSEAITRLISTAVMKAKARIEAEAKAAEEAAKKAAAEAATTGSAHDPKKPGTGSGQAPSA